MKGIAGVFLSVFLVAVFVSVGLAATPMSDEAFVELCRSGTPYEVEAALQAGANPNARNGSGDTALISSAASHAHFFSYFASILIDAGANVNASNDCGMTALMKIVQFYPENEYSYILKKFSYNIFEVKKIGGTSLSRDEREWRSENIECLLRAGADIWARDIEGKTAADYAGISYDEEFPFPLAIPYWISF